LTVDFVQAAVQATPHLVAEDGFEETPAEGLGGLHF